MIGVLYVLYVNPDQPTRERFNKGGAGGRCKKMFPKINLHDCLYFLAPRKKCLLPMGSMQRCQQKVIRINCRLVRCQFMKIATTRFLTMSKIELKLVLTTTVGSKKSKIVKFCYTYSKVFKHPVSHRRVFDYFANPPFRCNSLIVL